MDDPAKALEDARKAGIDLTMQDANLTLSVEERWAQHEAVLKLALELQAEGLIDEIEGMRIDQVYAIAAKRRAGET
ncbi:MAG TPA: hypothetical protein VIK52_04845 [Opitutaceae bacterium]